MKRLRRWVFNLAAGISLLGCVGVCALWVRGQSAADWFHWTQTRDHEWRRETLVAGGDGFYASHQWFFFDDPGHARKYAEGLGATSGFSHEASRPQRNPFSGTFWSRLGFGMTPGVLTTDTASDGPYRYVFSNAHVPYWFVLAVLSPPWCIWLARAHPPDESATRSARPMHTLRLRPPRHAGSVPGVRRGAGGGERGDDMKRWRRWLFNFAAGGSVVVCIASAVLWFRSSSQKDGVYISAQFMSVNAISRISRYGRACLMVSFRDFVRWDFTWIQTRQSQFGMNTVDQIEPSATGFGFGFNDYAFDDGSTGRTWILTIPFWFIILCCSILPARRAQVGYRQWRRNRAANRRLCLHCGYDLCATPARCPECGAVPEAVKGGSG